MLDVYYVKGIDPTGNVVALAKFFRRSDADAHIARLALTSIQAPYRDVGIVIEQERLEDQAPEHLIIPAKK